MRPQLEGSQDEIKNCGFWARFSDAARRHSPQHQSRTVPGKSRSARWSSSSRNKFRFPTGRPGNVIDFFSRTGLFHCGDQGPSESVAQAIQFLRTGRDVLRSKLWRHGWKSSATGVGKRIWLRHLPGGAAAALACSCGPLYGDYQFDNIVRFIVRPHPRRMPSRLPGTARHRDVHRLDLRGSGCGRQDSQRARPHRSLQGAAWLHPPQFGSTILVNAAHASDSEENAVREIGIIQPAITTSNASSRSLRLGR